MGIRAANRNHLHVLQWHYFQCNLAYKTGDTLGIGYKVKLRTAEHTHLTAGQHDAGTDHIIAEPSRLIRTNARSALRQPPTDGRRWIAGRVQS